MWKTERKKPNKTQLIDYTLKRKKNPSNTKNDTPVLTALSEDCTDETIYSTVYSIIIPDIVLYAINGAQLKVQRKRAHGKLLCGMQAKSSQKNVN